MIEVNNIQKAFKVARRDAGFSNAVKALFHKEYDLVRALDGISFTISDGEMVEMCRRDRHNNGEPVLVANLVA